MALWQRSNAMVRKTIYSGAVPDGASIKKGDNMPVRKVGNKYQYGTTGKKYTSRKKAEKQGLAIRLSQLRRGKKIK